jgi:eukaryotic-like serine/threonine-protein kinase
VISTSPPENSQLEKGRTVVLVVSSGPEQVTVPDVVGNSEADARSALENAGLQVDVAESESEDEDPGTVLAQDPEGGGEVSKGSTVTITLATAPPQVEVPDVIDQSEQDATAALTGAGFEVRRHVEDVDTLDQDGVVVDQAPAGGERLSRGSRVTITVGRFTPPLDPEPGGTPTPTATPTPTEEP